MRTFAQFFLALLLPGACLPAGRSAWAVRSPPSPAVGGESNRSAIGGLGEANARIQN